MTKLQVITDDDATTLGRSLRAAPWREGAGVDVTDTAADVVLICLTRAASRQEMLAGIRGVPHLWSARAWAR